MTILGGGPAGLAAGYYAHQRGIPFTIFEASGRLGGNAVTLKHGAYSYDSGAHRWHDKDAEATCVIKSLLGDELLKVDRPSFIFTENQFVDFPLSPLNLARTLGLWTMAKAALEVTTARSRTSGDHQHFESFALRTYGTTLAGRFLLGYSEKLWGLPCNRLSPLIAGNRMKGLTLKTFLKEAFKDQGEKTEHLDGSFYYPRGGIGAIADALARACGEAHIEKNARVTALRHDGMKITSVEINGSREINAGFVVSTLPLDKLISILKPSPPDDILLLTRALHYRNIVLVALYLDRESVSSAATIYFPGTEFPFTRICEPRNRSPYMSPPGKTSLVAEIPCQAGDSLWRMEEGEIAALVVQKLVAAGLIHERNVIGHTVNRIPYAYPVLETGFEKKIEAVEAFLRPFTNLALSGRSGRFAYVHLHDMMVWGKQVVDRFIANPQAVDIRLRGARGIGERLHMASP